jgi:mono/diheme cytochrome c family protein
MKKLVLRGVAIILILLVIVVAGGYVYISSALPNINAPENLEVEITPERLERGEYLAHHVALCMDCHSVRDWDKFGGPPIPGTEGGGGEVFTREMGLPGVFYATNITPAGIGDWTDGELFRAITSGVNKDGEALFPIMPYMYYGRMDEEDILSIIAYIRTLDPIEAEYPEREVDFPMSLIINTIPSEPDFHPIPDPGDKIAYGKYLAGACMECHTPFENGQPDFEKAFTGGAEFPMPKGGTLISPNITPDKETGMGNWTEEQFISRFKQYEDSSYVSPYHGRNEFNSIMPWTMFAGMTEGDLSAIYAYLMTLEPVYNKTEKFIPDPDN